MGADTSSRQISRTLPRRRTLLSRMSRPAEGEPLSIFCSGIGGTGLSGLARILAALGHDVRGSDQSRGPLAAGLEEAGVPIVYSQARENVPPTTDLFICTAALPATHPELVAAIDRGIPVVKYAEALGALVAARRGVAISGTHGKTTTTALTAHVLRACGRDPSWIVGGAPKDLEANSRLGTGPELVLEACEYDRSFRHYQPAVTVVTNVEEDHLDCYADLAAIVDAFVEFGRGLRDNGSLVVSADWPKALEVGQRVKAAREDVTLYTFGVDNQARFFARDVSFEDGDGRFELVVDGAPVARVRLSIPGRHNVANALAAIAAAAATGVDPVEAARACEAFQGVRRRFDVLGEPQGITIVDDYAHHPTAVEAVVDAARKRYPGRRVVALFEPHQASRTRQHFDHFARALAGADRAVVADIYVCRDTPEDVKAVTAKDLARAVTKLTPHAPALAPGAGLMAVALGLLRPGDVALFMGAGRMSGLAQEAAKRIAERGAFDLTPPPEVETSGRAPRRLEGGLSRLTEVIERELGPLVQADARVGPLTTFACGGTARLLSAPTTEEQAVQVVRAMQRRGVPVVPLGGGSNTLFGGGKLDALVLVTTGLTGHSLVNERTLRVAAGHPLQGVLRLAERHGLAGLEAFAGIPGTIGGAVAGNAGGPPNAGSVGERAVRVRLLEPDGAVAWHPASRLALRYRGSELRGALILEVELELTPDDKEALRARRLEATRKKAAGQPLDAKSAGCFFRNPPGDSAGRLIDSLGLKGLRVGGACVSPIHANFIVNDGEATSEDVLALVGLVQKKVREARGITLVPEVRLVA